MKNQISKYNYLKSYVLINRKILEDKTLSWKAKGLASFIATLPENYTFTLEELEDCSIGGKNEIRSLLKLRI